MNKREDGVSMITLVVIIIILIILASIAFTSTNTIEEATEVAMMQELAEVRKGVNLVRMTNAKEGTDEETINEGFAKVNVIGAPDNFKSFDDDAITGYVVDLEKIEYTNVVYGHEYDKFVTGDTIQFDVDDVFVYDAAGSIYYTKGYVLEATGEVFYGDDEKERLEGPTVRIIDTSGGNVKIEVTPKYGRAIESVLVGGREANTTDGTIYTITVNENKSYIVIATESEGGTTRTAFTITDITNPEERIPVINNVYFNSYEEYTKEIIATLNVEATNASDMYFSKNANVAPDVNDESMWTTYRDAVDVELSEGKNRFYVWCKNEENKLSEYKVAEINLDTIAPSDTAPSYIISGFAIDVTSNQTDNNDISIEYGYKTLTGNYTWQESNIITNVVPGEQYVIVTKAVDPAGNETISREVTTTAIPTIPGGVVINSHPERWSDSVNVIIEYPNTYGVLNYENVYRINSGEWTRVLSNKKTIVVDEKSIIEAAVAVKIGGDNFQTGEIATKAITNIDKEPPVISNITQTLVGTPATECIVSAKIYDSESGVVAWTATKNDVTPETWIEEFEATTEEKEISFKVTQGGTYYIYVRDDRGQIASASTVVNNIDLDAPEIKSVEIIYKRSEAIFKVVAQDIGTGISFYAVTKGNNVEPTNADWIEIENTKQEEEFTYSVTENGIYNFYIKDDVGRISSTSREINVIHDLTYDYETNGGESINISDTTIEVGCNENVDLSPIAEADDKNFIGWNIDPNATEALGSYQMSCTEDVILYAIFSVEASISLIYYDGNELINEVITQEKYNAGESCSFEIPEITATYTGWSQLGWTTGTANNATVEYSGDNIVVDTNTNIKLYMMYEKSVSALCKHYTYELLENNDNASLYLYVEEVIESGETKYKAYREDIYIQQGIITTNAYNIENSTTAKVTLPDIESDVRYDNTTWNLRGWSTSSDSDAVIEYVSNEEIEIKEECTLYASYQATLIAHKHMYGTEDTVTGIATMTSQAIVKPAQVNLGTAEDITSNGESWTSRGWSNKKEGNAEITVSNNSSTPLYKDTDFYASYERNVEKTVNLYVNQTEKEILPAYINYEGDIINATFRFKDITPIVLNGKEWLGRGYSAIAGADADIVATVGTEISTYKDITYYVSYYTNINITKKLLTRDDIDSATVLLAHDGTIKEATIKLGNIDDESYYGYTWSGTCWSSQNDVNTTENIAIEDDIIIQDDVIYYAIYERDVNVTTYAYNNQIENKTGTARLIAGGSIKNANINLGSSPDVTISGETWTHGRWSETGTLTEETGIGINEEIETYADKNYYAVYEQTVSIKAYYSNVRAGIEQEELEAIKELNYTAEEIKYNYVQLPLAPDITENGITWNPIGYLRKSDGYTISSTDGTIAQTNGESVLAKEPDEYYAIYETIAKIEKIEASEISGDNSITATVATTINVPLKRNSERTIKEEKIILGTIPKKGALIGAGWNTNGEILNDLSEIEIQETEEVVVTQSKTYYAYYTYSYEYKLSYYDEVIEGTAIEHRSCNGDKTEEIKRAKALYTVSVDGEAWTFMGMINKEKYDGEIIYVPNEGIQLNKDSQLYAVYSKNITINMYDSTGELEEKYGAVILNYNGEKEAAAIDMPEIADVTDSNGTWVPRGWSTGTGATAGADFVVGGGTCQVFSDKTYYASYKRTVTVTFEGYNGTAITTKIRNGTAYRNWDGSETTGAIIIVPGQEEYAGWTANGYTETTDAKITNAIDGMLEILNNTTIHGTYTRIITITYDANGGTDAPAAQESNIYVNTANMANVEGEPIIISTEKPVYNSYWEGVFKTWTLVANDITSAIAPGEEATFTADTTLYALWTVNTYIVTLDQQSGSGGT